MPVVCSSCQNMKVYILMKSWTFLIIFKKNSKVNKSIGILKKLYNVLPRNSLIKIYKSFIQPPIDYGAIIFDQPENKSLCKKIELVQYNPALAITGQFKVLPEKRCIKN